MAEPTPAERLAQLRQRWERDPKSRLFLQLAEEYRRAGRLSEAVRILESGLGHHPTYVAAQVVMGRCLLETGDMPRAVKVFERAVALDPTQIVANRLLVEAYLGVDDVAKARERLDIYRVLNDRDTEIEGLESRIAALGGVSRPVLVRGRPERDDRSGERRLPGAPAVAAATAPGSRPVAAAATESAPSAAVETPWAPAAAPARTRGRVETPFGALHRPADTRRIIAAFASGGIFPVALRPAAARPTALLRAEVAPPEPPSLKVESSAPEPVWSPEPTPEPSFAFESAATAATEPPPAREQGGWSLPPLEFGTPAAAEEESELESTSPSLPAPSWSEPEPSAVESLPAGAGDVVTTAATGSTTLGSLYLAQGHLDDAEESFEAVLRSRPDDAEARRGLDEVRRRKSEAAAAFFDEPVAAAEDSAAVVGGLTARKIDVLRQFMARMRRGSSAHVS